MTPATAYAGQRLALFGLGGSGLATAAALKAGGAEVIVWDDNAKAVEKAQAEGSDARDLRSLDWTGLAALVLAPGVPLTHPTPHWSVTLAQASGTPVIGDIEIFARERQKLAPSEPFIAITGTNGKSTTTALTAHIFAVAGRSPQMGGNIGTAILRLEPPRPDLVHVVECSSYQIDLAPGLDPSVGILLNLTPDHLDRHGSMEHYAAVKERLLSGVPKGGTCIVGVDDDWCRAIAARQEGSGRQVLRISILGPVADGLWFDGTLVHVMHGGKAENAFSLDGIGSLRGSHNAQNAMAAYAAAHASGVDHETILAAMRSFGGLAHRMEQVGRVGKVLFVNDSKATNADSTEKALASFKRIYWIAGGVPKAGGIEPLRPFFPALAKSYLIGQAAADFAKSLGGFPHVLAETLDKAIALALEDASRDAADEPVVLLSPACASFDQYPNFEVRGRAFCDIVRALPGVNKV